jgi:ATP-dependent DNA helicase RecQ
LEAHGVGQRKCDEYGDAILQCIREYAANPPPAAAQIEMPPARERKRPLAAEAAFVLFEEGQTIEEVAERLQRARSTTVGYLVDYIRSKDIRDPSPWIPPDIFERVHAAAQEVGELSATPIREFLNQELSYEEVQIALCCLRNAYEERV